MAKSKLNSSMDELMKEIGSLQKEIQKYGKKAFQEGDYVRTKLLIETTTRMDGLRDQIKEAGIQVADLQNEFETTIKNLPAGKTRRTTHRLEKGKKTPESEYKMPILKALMDLDGKGSTSDVLDKVHSRMKNTLNHYDRQPVPSVPSQHRWRHTAQIVRNKMVKEGLIKSNSPRGEWEISAAGKKLLTSEKPGSKSSSRKDTKKSSSKKK